MSSLRKRSRGTPKAKGFKSAADWPTTDDIDGFVWNVGPSEEDAAWAAANLNDDSDNPPDSYYDALADEAAFQDKLERGIRD